MTGRPEVDAPAGLHAVVLAAGQSRRLGTPKQLLELDGVSLLSLAVERARAASSRVAVVVGAASERIVPAVSETAAHVVHNPHWREGIASSLRAAVACLPANCTGVLVLLTDQPAVPADRVQELVAAWRRDPDRVVASRYAGTLGVPAILPRRLFASVAALQGDRGAGVLIAAEAAEVIAVAVPEAELDIDTEADWERFRTRASRC